MSQQLAQQPHVTLRDEQMTVPTTLLITNVDLGLHRYFDDKHAPLPQARLHFQMIATGVQLHDKTVQLFDNDGHSCRDVYRNDASRFDGRCFNVNYRLGQKELQALIAAGAYDDSEFMNRLQASFRGQQFTATMPLTFHDDAIATSDGVVAIRYVAFQPLTLTLDKYSDSTLPNVIFNHLRQMQDDFVALQAAQQHTAIPQTPVDSMAPQFDHVDVPTNELAFSDINVATSQVADVDNDKQQGAKVAVHDQRAAALLNDDSRFPIPSAASSAPHHVAKHTVQPNAADFDIPF